MALLSNDQRSYGWYADQMQDVRQRLLAAGYRLGTNNRLERHEKLFRDAWTRAPGTLVGPWDQMVPYPLAMIDVLQISRIVRYLPLDSDWRPKIATLHKAPPLVYDDPRSEARSNQSDLYLAATLMRAGVSVRPSPKGLEQVDMLVDLQGWTAAIEVKRARSATGLDRHANAAVEKFTACGLFGVLALDTSEILLHRNSLINHDRIDDQGGFDQCMRSHYGDWARQLALSLRSPRIAAVSFIGCFPGWSDRLNQFTVYTGVNSYSPVQRFGPRERRLARMQRRLVATEHAISLYD
jgi:hypothetical protein